MIKFDKKKTVIKGNPIDLMSQWTFIGNKIYEFMKEQIGEETAEKLMRKCVFKSEKQIVEEVLEIIKRKQEKESEESDNE